MPSYLHNIATVVPDTHYRQEFLREKMKDYVADDRRLKHLIHRIYSQSGIEKRHTVVDDFSDRKNGPPFYFREDQTVRSPSTGTRNDQYTKSAIPLLQETGERLLDQSSSIQREDITHVITVSCTGFFAPGPDLSVVRNLNLSADTRRYNLGFMGCYAAVPALQLANTICEADPDSCVLVICLELCTLHFQIGKSYDDIVAASLFADGAAGALISGQSTPKGEKALRTDQFFTTYLPEGEEDMAWSIGDSGFKMVLSSYVPRLIDTNLRDALAPLTAHLDKHPGELDKWAMHPGGKAIVDKLQDNFGLSDPQLSASRSILAEYGNMSSATILFVLQKILEEGRSGEQIMPLAFGPGLTIESGLFTIIS